MLLCHIFVNSILILVLVLQKSAARPTHEVTFSVIERLRIGKCIFVVDGLFPNPIAFSKDFKNLVKKVQTRFVDSSRIVEEVFTNVEKLDHRTLVVFQTMRFVTSLKTFAESQVSYMGLDGISLCKWLAFDNTTGYLIRELRELPIPFNSDFLIAVPSANSGYEISEMYHLLSRSIVLNFGNWTNASVNFSPLTIYQRRKDFGEIPVPYTLFTEDYLKESPNVLVNTDILEFTGIALNFTLLPVNVSETINAENALMMRETVNVYGILYNGDEMNILDNLVGPTNFFSFYFYGKDTGIFQSNINIFTTPFSYTVWTVIFVMMILNSLLFIMVQFSTSCPKSKRNYMEVAFVPFDVLCNQSNTTGRDSLSWRIGFFVAFFMGVFTSTLYLGIMTSYLISVTPTLPFDTVEEFNADGSYTLLLPEHSYDTLKQRLYINIEKSRTVIDDEIKLVSDLLRRTCQNEDYIFLGRDQVSDIPGCKLLRTKRVGKMLLGMALPPQSHLRNIFEEKFLLFREVGFLNRDNILLEYLSVYDKDQWRADNNVVEQYPLGPVKPLFYILSGFILLTGMIFVTEIIHKQIKR